MFAQTVFVKLIVCGIFYCRVFKDVSCCSTVPPHIRIPPEQQVIAVVGNDQPNTTFICEATRISACSTQISWIHNGRNTSQTINRRFQADITGINDGTIRSRLNANHLMGSDSGTVGCVAYCMVDIPSQKELLVLSTSRYTTLSVLSKCVVYLKPYCKPTTNESM